MRTIAKYTIQLFIPLLLFTCSENTIQEENKISESIVIPEDKEIEIEILEKINNYRISKSLSALIKLETIKSQTYIHTDHMIKKNMISHENFSERCNYLNSQIKARKVGENVASKYTDAESLVQGWLNNPINKNTIENNYTHFNITAKQNDQGIWFFTNIFIKK